MERARSKWFWPVAIFVALPFLYLASFVPIFWLHNHAKLFADRDGAGFKVMMVYAAPVRYAHDHGPRSIRPAVLAYIAFVEKL